MTRNADCYSPLSGSCSEYQIWHKKSPPGSWDCSDWLEVWWCGPWLVKKMILSSSPRGGWSKTNKQETFIASQTLKQQLWSHKKWLIQSTVGNIYDVLPSVNWKSSFSLYRIEFVCVWSNLNISFGFICESNAWLVDVKVGLEFIQMNVESSLCNLCK